jgi:hypothetical protein
MDLPNLENEVFEKASVLGHDNLIKPTANGSLRLEGEGAKGDIVEYLHVDDVEGKFYHEMKQNIEPVLNSIHQLELERGSGIGRNKKNDFLHAAHVPLVVLHDWLNKRGLQMRDFKHSVVDDFLNDTDNKAFRVWKGRV